VAPGHPVADGSTRLSPARINQLVYVLTYGEQVCRTGATSHVVRHFDIEPS